MVVVLIAACGPPVEAPPPPPARWHVSGGQLRDPDGRGALLRGVNLSGRQKHPPYLDVHTTEDYRRVRAAWGMNAVRFVMTWAAVEPAPGRYDDAYLDRVAERLEWARAAGLLVVLDMHQDVFGEGFGFDGAPRWACDESRYAAFRRREPWALNYVDPNVQACFDAFYTDAALQQRFAAAWRHVAERLGGAPAVIGFDVLNEPHWGSYPMLAFEADLLGPMYRRVVAEVRAVRPGWIAFLEPSASRNLGVATGLEPFGFGDVVYAPHSYDTEAELGGGFDPARRAAIDRHVRQIAGEARALGAALWVGEYGGTSASKGLAEYMDAEYAAFGRAAASSMYWEYGRDDGGYGMLAVDGSPKPALMEALVRPWPERVAGDPIEWSWDGAARRFTFRWRVDSSVRAPTEIVAPARVWPGGVKVECAGCEVEMAGERVRVMRATPGAGGEVTVVLRD